MLPVTILLVINQTQYKGHAAGTSTFITRSGSDLILNGQKFRFAGTNTDWLGWNDNLHHYTTHSEVQSTFSNAKSMNETVFRNFGLIPIGTSFSIEPSLNIYNDAAFEPIDYELSIAPSYGIYFIIPFVDNWDQYYDHGKSTYTTWEGMIDENQFYYSLSVIQDFKNHIAHILNHVNQYTGVAYKNDPSIMAWESGNELDGAPYAWTESIAEYIKSIDTNHLFLEGLPFHYGGSNTAQLQNEPSVDMYSDHYYPPYASDIQNDVNLVKAANKVYFIGEYDWHSGESASDCPTYGSCGGDPLATILSAVENNPANSGDLYWELELSSVDPADSYYFTLHYPGDNSDMQTRVQQLTQHGIVMNASSGTPIPTATPTAINTTMDDSIMGTGQNQWNYVGTGCNPRLYRKPGTVLWRHRFPPWYWCCFH